MDHRFQQVSRWMEAGLKEATKAGLAACDEGRIVTATPIRCRVPAACPHCGAEGSVHPEVTIVGGSLTRTWCCKACTAEWPITSGERYIEEHRSGVRDRRRTTRKERRRNS